MVSDAMGEWLPRRAAELQEALTAEKNRKGLVSRVLFSGIPIEGISNQTLTLSMVS
jgi:hypothetical protein